MLTHVSKNTQDKALNNRRDIWKIARKAGNFGTSVQIGWCNVHSTFVQKLAGIVFQVIDMVNNTRHVFHVSALSVGHQFDKGCNAFTPFRSTISAAPVETLISKQNIVP